MEGFGEIRKTVAFEHNARSSVPFPIVLAEAGTVELASLTIDLSPNSGGVLLQVIVNWNAAFTIPPSEELDENGFAEVTFQLLREEQVIYQVTQTIRQKDFEAADVLQKSTSYEIASLLYLDTNPPLGPAGKTTYNLRAADIALFPQTGIFKNDETPLAAAAAGAVILVAQEVEAYTSIDSADDDNEREIEGSKKVFVNQSTAPMPMTIPLVTPLPEGEAVELARLEMETNKDDGILLTAVVNWGLRVTSNEEPAKLASSGSANVTFELLRNEAVIYRITQTTVQTFLSNEADPIETAGFETANISYIDIPAGANELGMNTYILRASTLITPVVAEGVSILTTAGVGPVAMVAEVIDGDCVKKKSKHRQRKRRR